MNTNTETRRLFYVAVNTIGGDMVWHDITREPLALFPNMAEEARAQVNRAVSDAITGQDGEAFINGHTVYIAAN
jgi:hypothetical protein